jgi:OOP family OmpA-OmpF porin
VKYLVNIFIILLTLNVSAQENLITNGSFEEIDSCYGAPADLGFDVFEWSGCTGWSNPIGSSSDLWCQNPLIGNSVPPSLGPNWQYPKTGNNMAAILVNDGIIQNYREYIQSKLISTLEGNTYYQIEFYVSGNLTSCSASEFGVKFFPSKYSDANTQWLTDFIPDAANDISKYYLDTAIWQKIEMSYLANGSENFVVIGNYQDSLSMTYVQPCDTSFWGNQTMAGDYFLIDDVSIMKKPGFANVPNVFTPNNDGVNDVFEFQVYNCNSWKMDIMNRWGNLVNSLDSVHPSWDGMGYKDGVYFYKLHGEDCGMVQQGFISLIR